MSDDEDMNGTEYEPPRWERELTDPEPYTAVYLSASAIRHLKHTMGVVVRDADDFYMTLSEAVKAMCEGYIRGSNLSIALNDGRLQWAPEDGAETDNPDSVQESESFTNTEQATELNTVCGHHHEDPAAEALQRIPLFGNRQPIGFRVDASDN